MKKIFILPILIAPIAAMADDPVGPAAASGTPVVATETAPYETATINAEDSTTVVSASYVKGGYNDAIAAVNRVNADKQDKLWNNKEKGGPQLMSSTVKTVIDPSISSPSSTHLVTEAAVYNAITSKVNSKRVNAVTAWGNDTPTKLTLADAN